MPGVIQLRTEIPGPDSRALLARRAQAVPRGVPAVTPHRDRARGRGGPHRRGRQSVHRFRRRHRRGEHRASARRSGGRRCGSNSTGSPTSASPSRPTSPTSSWPSGSTALTPGTREKRTFFVNSGAEAVENAVKVARAFTGRQAVVCFEHGFHGRTNLAMALTSKVMPYKKGFGPFAPEVYRIPFPYCYRCDAADRRGGGTGAVLHGEPAIPGELFAATVDPGSVAAIIMELELGEGGFVPAPVEYVRTLAAFAREHGILFIADEIQTGFGRTGRLFACEHYGLDSRSHHHRQVAGRRPAARGGHRPRRRDGGCPGRRARRHLRGQPAGLRRGARGAGCHGGGADPGAGPAQAGDRIRSPVLRVGRRATPASATCAGSARWSAMELVTDRASRTPDKALTGRAARRRAPARVVLL